MVYFLTSPTLTELKRGVPFAIYKQYWWKTLFVYNNICTEVIISHYQPQDCEL
jgi:hypothetical protein